MARQFNLIPPVCEQAEYHYFQRDKVEVQLPELYHKIGQTTALYFSLHFVAESLFDCLQSIKKQMPMLISHFQVLEQ